MINGTQPSANFLVGAMSALGQKQTCHYVRVCRNGKARFGVMWLALELKLFAMTCPITQTTSWTLCKVTA